MSLGNPRLGFVCVSEDMSGQYGLCGYFREHDHDLAEDERLIFAPHEHPPAFDPPASRGRPRPNGTRSAWPRRGANYAVDYIRNGVAALVQVLGRERALALASPAARLTGLQQYRRMAKAVGGVDGGPSEAARLPGGDVRRHGRSLPRRNRRTPARLHHQGLRVLRGLPGDARADLLACWTEIWRGALHSHRAFMDLSVEPTGDDSLVLDDRFKRRKKFMSWNPNSTNWRAARRWPKRWAAPTRSSASTMPAG